MRLLLIEDEEKTSTYTGDLFSRIESHANT